MTATFTSIETLKNITFISDGVLSPTTRFRVDPIASILSERGWKVRSIFGYGALDQRIPGWYARKLYRFAGRARRAIATSLLHAEGPVLLQRLAIPTWSKAESILCRHNGKVVFDFDDAIFMDPYLRENRPRRNALNQIFEECAHVVAGNQWLAGHVKADTPVSIIPTCIDTDRYVPLEVPADRPVTIGWMGTATNLRYLQQLVDTFQRLRSKHEFRVVVCSDVRNDSLLSELGATFVRWSAENEVDTLQSFDVGLMPLADTDWCRGKCSFKLIQYLSVGIPTVSSAVGMNNEVVQSGENGFLAVNEDWDEPLDQLLSSPSLRDRMGQLGRQTAVRQYSLPVAANAYERIFGSLLRH